MPDRPAVIVFDVNETLSDMSPLAGRFTKVGAPAHLAQLWFTSLLRDGFARTASGESESFSTLAEGALRVVLSQVLLDRPEDEAVRHVLAGIPLLQLHPDVPAGIERLRESGFRLVTLSNGASSVAEGLLAGAGLLEHFEAVLTVEDAGVWKPAAGSYAYAAETCGVAVGELMLVASHPWDTDGAQRAGARAAWVNRTGARWPSYFRPPDLQVRAIGEVATALR